MPVLPWQGSYQALYSQGKKPTSEFKNAIIIDIKHDGTSDMLIRATLLQYKLLKVVKGIPSQEVGLPTHTSDTEDSV